MLVAAPIIIANNDIINTASGPSHNKIYYLYNIFMNITLFYLNFKSLYTFFK